MSSRGCTATPAFRRRRLIIWSSGALSTALVILAVATCSTSEPLSACPTPQPGSKAADLLTDVRSRAGFPVLYPCQLPGAEYLESVAVTGDPGRQKAELVFAGPFEMAIRQSQYPPAVSADPAGASRTIINLFPNVRATFIQINDGSSKALYHLFWKRGGIYYEVQAVGPPLQQRQIRLIATSLD